jgi:hypothetical protein
VQTVKREIVQISGTLHDSCLTHIPMNPSGNYED